MREVQVAEAEAHFARLLEEVERGESLIITRQGRAVARIEPEAQSTREDVLRAIAEIQAARKGKGKISVEELLSARDEGRR